jgi:hypothetical protein
MYIYTDIRVMLGRIKGRNKIQMHEYEWSRIANEQREKKEWSSETLYLSLWKQSRVELESLNSFFDGPDQSINLPARTISTLVERVEIAWKKDQTKESQ